MQVSRTANSVWGSAHLVTEPIPASFQAVAARQDPPPIGFSFLGMLSALAPFRLILYIG
jgi:hypothetical protein